MLIQDATNTLLYDQPTAATLQDMLLVDDVALTHEVFAYIHRQFSHATITLNEAKALIDLLPQAINHYPPETQRLLANIFLITQSHRSTLPQFEASQLQASVAAAWAKTIQALAPPKAYATSLGEQALSGDISGIEQSPVQTIQTLCQQGLIPPEFTKTLLLKLTKSDQAHYALESIAALSKPWASTLPDFSHELNHCLNDERLAKPALTLLAQWKPADFLIEFASNSRNRHLIQHTFELIDAPLNGSQISLLLDLAQQDAIFLGPAVTRAFRNQHRRRHNFSKAHIADLFELFILAPTIPLDDLSEIVCPSEKRWLHLLEALHPHDQSWERHIQLISQMNTHRGNAFLVACLSDPELAALQADIIVALSHNGVSTVEPQALSLFEKGQKEKAIIAIRHIGGIQSKQCLWAHIEGSKTIAGLAKTDALQCALAIEENPATVLNLIPPGLISCDQLPRLNIASQEATDCLLALLDSDDSAIKKQAITQLGNSGGEDCLNALTDQLLHLPEAEDAALVHQAIQSIGQRLYTVSSARPSVLLTAQSAQQAGEHVLANCLLNLCEHTDLCDETLTGLLETVSTLQCQEADRRLQPYLHHNNPLVQKPAITGLCHNGCAHLSDQLRHFLQDDNIYTRRAAIVGLTKLKVTGLDTEIADSLNHPNMNIKKAAAEALEAIGTVRSAPMIIHWIASHDNQGLQARLIKALKQIVGDDYVPLILAHVSKLTDASDESKEDSPNTNHLAQRHLLLALNHELAARAVVIAYQDKAVWATPLITLINHGEYQLKDDQGSSHLYFEAWRLGIDLPPMPTNAALNTARKDTDELLNSLISGTAPANQDVASYPIPPLSTAQIIRLKRQLPTLIKQLSTPQGEIILKVLLQLIPNLCEGQKTLLSAALQTQLGLAKLPLEPLLHCLKACDALLPNAIATKALNTASTELQVWGLHTLLRHNAIDTTSALSLLDNEAPSLRTPLINYLLKRQAHQALLEHCLHTKTPYIETLQAAWNVSTISPTETVNSLLTAIKSAPDPTIERLLQWVSNFSDERVDQLLLRYLSASNHRYREVAIHTLSSRPSAALASDLSQYLTHQQSDTRQAAATILLAWSDKQYLPEIIKYYLQGSLSHIGYPRLDHTLLDNAKVYLTNTDAKKKYMALVCHSALSAYEQIEQLWPLLDEQDPELRTAAESAISGLPAQTVLDYLWPQLSAGQWGYLTLLKRNSHDALVDHLINGNEATQRALLEHFIGLPPPLRSERLHKVLPDLQTPSLTDLTIELSGKLTAWQQPKARVQLLENLQNYLANGGNQSIAVNALSLGISQLPIQEQLAAIQQLLTEQTQQALLPEWVERCLQRPSAFHELPEKWQPNAYEYLIEMTGHRDEEKARGALKLLADLDHEAILDTIEDALLHPKSRVRAYAHRLLRKLASPEQYLESTLILLTDKELALRCSAIRTLSFRGYIPAVKGIAEQLFIKKKNVARVAKAGLLTMGQLALPDLKQIASRARPDQRGVLLDIISDIESRH